LKTTEKAEKLC